MALPFGQPAGRTRPLPADALLLDALEEFVVGAQPSARGAGLMALCHMLARLVEAPAVGHACIHLYDSKPDNAHLTVWRRGGGTALDIDEPPARISRARDPWSTSSARRQLLDRLDQRHIVELPLNPDRVRPTMLVVGRERPFTDIDHECMHRAHRSLAIIEEVIDALCSEPRMVPAAIPAEPPPPGPPPELTAREHEVLTMLGEGLLARSIAQQLDVSERTVHKHLGNVYRKLDAHDRLLAVRRAEMLGLLPTPTAARW